MSEILCRAWGSVTSRRSPRIFRCTRSAKESRGSRDGEGSSGFPREDIAISSLALYVIDSSDLNGFLMRRFRHRVEDDEVEAVALGQ